MSGEADLARLLRAMQPILRDGEYVFCALQPNAVVPAGVAAVCTVHEDEGLTLVLARGQADAAGLAYGPVFRWITLSVHSSLEAVGFLAAVTGALAARGVGVNAIAGYYHDHLFVPAEHAGDALVVLDALAAG